MQGTEKWIKGLHSECKMGLRRGYPEMLCQAQDSEGKVCWSGVGRGGGVREGCRAAMIQALRPEA